jgi:hypothetical protein
MHENMRRDRTTLLEVDDVLDVFIEAVSYLAISIYIEINPFSVFSQIACAAQ